MSSELFKAAAREILGLDTFDHEPSVATSARAITNAKGVTLLNGNNLETPADVLAALGGSTGAKLVEVADTTARLALTAAQVNVGDIVREVGVLGTIIVSGAGTSSANGTYTEDGRLNGYMRFRKVVGSSAAPAIVFDSWSGYWVIVDSEDAFGVLYYDQNYSSTTDPTDGTDFTLGTGSSPAPTLAWGVAPIAAGKTYLATDVGNLSASDGWTAVAGPSESISLTWAGANSQTFSNGSNTTLKWGGVSDSVGDLFSYNAGTGAVTLARDALLNINLSLGSQGTNWSAVSKVAFILLVNGSVANVFWELMVQGDGALYPPASCLITRLNAGDTIAVAIYPYSGTPDEATINELSALIIVEI